MSAHATPSAYADGCRCDECRQAKATYMREKRAAARAYADRVDGRYVADLKTHGIGGYVNHKCRCPTCCAAAVEAQRRYRTNRVRKALAARGITMKEPTT